MPYLKRTDGRQAAGEGRAISGVSLRRDDADAVVFIADEKRAGDVTITKSVYDEALAANNVWNEAHRPAPPPDPEPPLTNNELKQLRALLD